MPVIGGRIGSSPRVALVLSVALGVASCSDSPTEPGSVSSASVISLAVDSPPVLSETGTLTLTSAVCGCTMFPLIVAVNGDTVGNMPCASRQAFPMPLMEAGTARYRILVTNGFGTTGLMSFDVSSDKPAAPSLAVRAFCP